METVTYISDNGLFIVFEDMPAGFDLKGLYNLSERPVLFPAISASKDGGRTSVRDKRKALSTLRRPLIHLLDKKKSKNTTPFGKNKIAFSDFGGGEDAS